MHHSKLLLLHLLLLLLFLRILQKNTNFARISRKSSSHTESNTALNINDFAMIAESDMMCNSTENDFERFSVEDKEVLRGR